MALIQRYTADFTSQVGTHQQLRDEHSASSTLANQIATIKRTDVDEKRYLHSLNDRLENLLGYLNRLESTNKTLHMDVNELIRNWGIETDRNEYFNSLTDVTRRMSNENRRRVHALAETKLFSVQTELTDRVSSVLIDVLNYYREQMQMFDEWSQQLDDDYRQIQHRLTMSNNQVKSFDDDYRKELTRFRGYVAEWSQIALDKQHLLNEIQSLKEQYHLRLAYHQEELNEWKRLLTRASHESTNFYRDYLDTIKQQIQLDYQQMAKDQHTNMEHEYETRLKDVKEQFRLGRAIDSTGIVH
jgi:chromosome segregation ATPase